VEKGIAGNNGYVSVEAASYQSRGQSVIAWQT
jgi:hypothetical protein